MAITVKSVSQLLADSVRRLLAETSVTDVTPGSVIGTILEAAALADFQNQVSLLKVLESSNLESLVGSDLDSKAIELAIPDGIGGIGRVPARRSSGAIRIGSNFSKLSSALYLGKSAPYIGALRVYVQNASGWPATGQVYIGRGSLNEEGPINYTSIQNFTTYYELTLSVSTPLVKNHGFSETVVLAQGGTRSIPAGTSVIAPASSGNVSVQFSTDTAALLLDGEAEASVPVTSSTFGEEGNVASGAIKTFSNIPFAGATVTNGLAFSNGAGAETDENLRERIKNHFSTLGRGTKSAIASALRGLRDPVSGKAISSVSIIEPALLGDPARCYIDDGSGLEPTLDGQDFENLLTSASGQELLFRTARYPVTPPTVIGTNIGPFQLEDSHTLSVSLDGVSETFRVYASDYQDITSAGMSEIVRTFNAQATSIGFRTAESGKYLVVFDRTGKAEVMQVTSGDLQKLLGFSTEEIRPLYLYKNNQLQSFKGTTATLTTAVYPWSGLDTSDLASNIVVVDGVEQTVTITNADFTRFGTTIATASLAQWATVLATKVAGVKFAVSGNTLVWTSWQTNSSSGSLEVKATRADSSAASWIGLNKLWASSQALSDTGATADYEFNRFSGQIKLKNKLDSGSNITLGSRLTRAEAQSLKAATGQFGLGANSLGTPKIIVAADGEFAVRSVAPPNGSTVAPTAISVNSNLVKLTTDDLEIFRTVEVGDFIYPVRDTTSVKPFPTRAVFPFIVKRKGLNTRLSNATFTGATFTLLASSSLITVTTTSAHELVPGASITISNAALTGGSGITASDINGSRTVVSTPTTTSFTFNADATVSSAVSPNTLDALLYADSFVEIETAADQKDALLGVFTDKSVSVSLGSATISVTMPLHDFIVGDTISVTSVSTDLASVFGGSGNITGSRTISAVTSTTFSFSTATTASSTVGTFTLTGAPSASPYPYEMTLFSLRAFKSDKAQPHVIDFGSVGTASIDSLVSTINATAIGFIGYKISPRQLGIRSNNFDSVKSTLGVLAVIGTAVNFIETSANSSIQPHVASRTSGDIASGFPYVTSVTPFSTHANFYATRSFLNIAKTNTQITDYATNPAISSTAGSYPLGTQEIFIAGKNLNLIARSYHNSSASPFAGFTRGTSTQKPDTQTVPGTNVDNSSSSIKALDLPFSVNDKLVIEMDQDEVNKTTAIPMAKAAEILSMVPLANGAVGAQLEFTLRDPDDKDATYPLGRPFFASNSQFKTFDLTDFNILVRPSAIHAVFPSIAPTSPYVGSNPANALVIKSTQYGPQHRMKFSFILPDRSGQPNLAISHKSLDDGGIVNLFSYCTLTSGPTINGSLWVNSYTLTPSNFTSPTGAEIVKLTIAAAGINSGGKYVVGNILNITGASDYTGSYLITETPSANSVVVAAPGIRAGSYSALSLDGAVNPVSSFSLLSKTIDDVIAAAVLYFPNSPVFTVEKTSGSVGSTPVIYPSYFTHGNLTADTSLTTISDSIDYHSLGAPYGCMAHIHTYDPLLGQIKALVQHADPILPTSAQLASTGYSYIGEKVFLLPANSKALEKWLNYTVISPLMTQSDVVRVNSQQNIQISSLNSGSDGAVQITGVNANAQIASLEAGASREEQSLRMKTNVAAAQSMPHGSMVSIENAQTTSILRSYRTTPSAASGDSVITAHNTADIVTYFRPTTVATYTRHSADVGRFEFSAANSGLVVSDTVDITVTGSIARINRASGTGTLNARVGDMLVIKSTSAFATANKSNTIASDTVNQYIGYPVVHVASTTEIYVVAPNMTSESGVVIGTVSDLMFIPAIFNEKNIKTNYKAGARYLDKISSTEKLFYRIKKLGAGFVYCELSATSTSDMLLDDLSVSTDDFIQLGEAFEFVNRGKFRIVAHNGTNVVIFHNPNALDEIVEHSIVDGVYGSQLWMRGPIGDSDTSASDKRHVRIFDADSIAIGDSLVITSPQAGASWLATSLIGSWLITEIGITSSYSVYVKCTVAGAPTGSQTVTLGTSVSSVSFREATPYKGFKFSLGYAQTNAFEEFADLYLAPPTSAYKIDPSLGAKLTAKHKAAFDTDVTYGIDAYKYYTELIAEAHKVVDGSSTNSISFPGIRASGTAVEILAPLIKTINLNLTVESKEGVGLNSIKNPVRSVVSSYINSLGVGKPVVLSELTKAIQVVPGVKSVVINSTFPSADNGFIAIGSEEIARVQRAEDITL